MDSPRCSTRCGNVGTVQSTSDSMFKGADLSLFLFAADFQPYKFIGFGAMDATRPYKFIGFGALDANKPYKFMLSKNYAMFGFPAAPTGPIDVPTGGPRRGPLFGISFWPARAAGTPKM